MQKVEELGGYMMRVDWSITVFTSASRRYGHSTKYGLPAVQIVLSLEPYNPQAITDLTSAS